MRRHQIILLGAVVLLGFHLMTGLKIALSAESTPTTWTDNLPFRLTGEVEVGGQVVQPRGNSPTFDEYRDLDRTDRGGEGHIPVVPYLHILGENKERTNYLEFGGTNLSRMDANYYLNAGKYNYLRFSFEFDRTQHVIGHSAQTIYDENGTGVFTIPNGAALAAALNGVGSPPTAAQRAAVIGAVNDLEHATGLGYQTDAARIGFNWLPLPELELSLRYSHTDRDGHMPFGTVIGSPGSSVIELSAPREDRFHEVKAGAEYVRDWYQLRFNYTFSLYEDDVKKVEWDNPCGAGAGGCTNPSGLGRSSTPPDSFAHTFSGAGGFTLPWWRTRLTAGASYSMWRQDETFLPWTTVAGFTGNTDDSGRSSPDARMNVINSNVNLTTHPLRNVTATTRYRYYELQNHSPVLNFTDVLNPGDTTPGAGVDTTEPRAFRKQNASQELSWRIIPQVTAKAIYEWEHWNRKDREVASSNEHTVRGVVDIQPKNWLLARLSYLHGVKTIGADGYNPLATNADAFNAPGLPQFQKFDEADRTRDKADVLIQVSPLDTLTLSGSFFAQKDNYFNSSFGLEESKAFGWSGDVSWAPTERMNFSVGYAHDEYQSHETTCAIPGGPPVTCDLLDTFFVKPRDLLDSVQANANFVIIPKRLDLGLGYRFTFGRSRQSVSSVPGGNPAGEPAFVPTTENKFQVFNIVARYFLTPKWTLKLGYQYERYTEKDFTTDGIGPSLASPAATAADTRSIILGSQHGPYEAHIVAFSAAYRF